MRLDELAREIEAEVVGDASIDITSVASLEDATPGQVSFLSNPKYAAALETTKASAIIIAARGKEPGGPKVICVMNADGTNVRRLSR